jgi:alkyl hydroperoxide reductase subunit AhpF
MPTGFEFGTLIETISDFSRSTTELSATTQQKIKAIDTPLEILIFVTPTCGYCPAAVRMANQAAMLNSNLSVAVIEANEFNDLANSYYVYGVPRTVINEKTGFDGAVSEAVFVTNLERAVKAAQNQQEISPKA